MGPQGKALRVESPERRSMADADHRRPRQPLLEKGVEPRLRLLVHGGGRLVEEEPLRLLHDGAGEGDALLLPGRELERPVSALAETLAELGQAPRLERLAQG